MRRLRACPQSYTVGPLHLALSVAARERERERERERCNEPIKPGMKNAAGKAQLLLKQELRKF
jgi:hypothetical protein